MVQVVRVPDTAPVVLGVVTPPSDDTSLVATVYTPPETPDPQVLSVVMPLGGTPPGGGAVDPAFREEVEAALAEIGDRLGTLELAPTPPPSGPAGGDLAGAYPNPTLAQQYALSGPTETALGGKAGRPNVRVVSSSVTAGKNDVLIVTTGASVITIAPPPNLAAGDEVTIMKVDSGSGRVVFNDDVNSDATATIVGQWNGATFLFTNPNWVVKSVSAAYSAAPSSSSGGSGGDGITREQADQRYDPIGAATAAISGVTKATLGLGNVENYSAANAPISNPVQQALNAKQPLQTPFHQTGSGNVTINAANGNVQALTATGNVVLLPPSNPSDMQSLRLEVFAQTTSRTVSTLSSIVNASTQPLPFTVAAGRCAILGLVYSARTTRWMLMSYVVEAGA